MSAIDRWRALETTKTVVSIEAAGHLVVKRGPQEYRSTSGFVLKPGAVHDAIEIEFLEERDDPNGPTLLRPTEKGIQAAAGVTRSDQRFRASTFR